MVPIYRVPKSRNRTVQATLDELLVYTAQSSTATMRIPNLILTDFPHRFFFNSKPYCTPQYSQPVMVVAKRGSSFDPSRNRAGSRNNTLVRTLSLSCASEDERDEEDDDERNVG